MSTVQRTLPLKLKPMKPLLHPQAAAALIGPDTTADDVLLMIEDAHLEWAWNIGSRRAERREVRVLSSSVEHYIVTGGFRREPEMPWEDMLKLALPDDKPFCECCRLMRRWSASNDLGLDLIAEGELKVVPGTTRRTGPGGSPLVTRESVIKFLERRRIT